MHSVGLTSQCSSGECNHLQLFLSVLRLHFGGWEPATHANNVQVQHTAMKPALHTRELRLVYNIALRVSVALSALY